MLSIASIAPNPSLPFPVSRQWLAEDHLDPLDPSDPPDPDRSDPCNQKESTRNRFLWIGLVFLFLLSIFSEVGYFLFMNEASNESLKDPLEKFVRIHVSVEFWSHLVSCTDALVLTCSIFQSIATLLAIFDMSAKVRNFGQELTKAFQQAVEGEHIRLLYCIMFLIHLILIATFYIVCAGIPWLGLLRSGHNNEQSILMGLGMFLGQITIYCLSYIDGIFSTPQRILHLLHSDQLFTVLANCFDPLTLRLDRWSFRFRTMAQLVTEAWFCFGTCLLFNAYAWTLPAWVPYFVACSAAYNTLTSQGPVKDYHQTFHQQDQNVQTTIQDPEDPEDLAQSQDETESSEQTRPHCKDIFLIFLLTPIYISHVLSIPSLLTGTLDDPVAEYTFLVMTKALIGLVLGMYAGYQYTYSYLYGLVREGLTCFQGIQIHNSTALDKKMAWESS